MERFLLRHPYHTLIPVTKRYLNVQITLQQRSATILVGRRDIYLHLKQTFVATLNGKQFLSFPGLFFICLGIHFMWYLNVILGRDKETFDTSFRKWTIMQQDTDK